MHGGNISTGSHHEKILRKTARRRSRCNSGAAYYRGHTPFYPAGRHVSSLLVQGVGSLIGVSITHRTNRAGRVACGE